MLHFIDISSWQEGLNLHNTPELEGVIIKATEGLNYVNPCCDGWVQQAIQRGLPWGVYHYGRANSATAEADYFLDNCAGYVGQGVLVLDWEEGQGVDWVNEFVQRIHDRTGVWAWIYANPWRFNQGGVNENCMRWVASYPGYANTTLRSADNEEPPYTQGGVGAWQFASNGRVAGFDGDLDVNVFYGDAKAWAAYAGKNEKERVNIMIPETKNAVHRLYNPDSGDHMLTASTDEANSLQSAGWEYEGIAFYADPQGAVPVYRVYNQNTGDHLLTASRAEAQALVDGGWADEGIAFHALEG